MQEEFDGKEKEGASEKDQYLAGKIPSQHEPFIGSLDVKQIRLEELDPARLASLTVRYWDHDTDSMQEAQLGKLFSVEGGSLEEAKEDGVFEIETRKADAETNQRIAENHATPPETGYDAFETEVPAVPEYSGDLVRRDCEFNEELGLYFPEKNNVAWAAGDADTLVMLNGQILNRQVIAEEETQIFEDGASYAYAFGLENVPVEEGDKLEIRIKPIGDEKFVEALKEREKELSSYVNDVKDDSTAYQNEADAAKTEAQANKNDAEAKAAELNMIVTASKEKIEESSASIDAAADMPTVAKNQKEGISACQELNSAYLSLPQTEANVAGYEKKIANITKAMADCDETTEDAIKEAKASVSTIKEWIKGLSDIFNSNSDGGDVA